MTHQKPGFPLEASITHQQGGATLIQFTLPDGQKMDMPGPPMTLDTRCSIDVMYFPDQHIKITLMELDTGKRMLIDVPISDMPPHDPTRRPTRTPRGRSRDNLN